MKKKLFLENFATFTRKLHACNFIKKRFQQIFSSQYCGILKNNYFEEHLLTAAPEFLKQLQNSGEQLLLY